MHFQKLYRRLILFHSPLISAPTDMSLPSNCHLGRQPWLTELQCRHLTRAKHRHPIGYQCCTGAISRHRDTACLWFPTQSRRRPCTAEVSYRHEARARHWARCHWLRSWLRSILCPVWLDHGLADTWLGHPGRGHPYHANRWSPHLLWRSPMCHWAYLLATDFVTFTLFYNRSFTLCFKF